MEILDGLPVFMYYRIITIRKPYCRTDLLKQPKRAFSVFVYGCGETAVWKLQHIAGSIMILLLNSVPGCGFTGFDRVCPDFSQFLFCGM